MLRQQRGGDVGRRLVELLNELLDDRRLVLVLAALHCEVVAPDQFAAPRAEQLYPRLALVVGERDHVRVLVAVGDDLLALRHGCDGAQLVTQNRGALELHSLRRALHARPQFALHALRIALHKPQHLMNHLAVAVGVRLSRAGGDAAMDVELEARALVRSRDRFRAGAVGEQFLQQVHRLADRPRACERPEVARAVGEDAPREVDLRERLGEVDLDVGIRLVVFEAGVEERLALLDQEILQQQRLLNRLGYDELEIRDALDHRADAPLLAGGRLEVRAHAVAEARRLADIQNRAVGALHQIDAGLRGQRSESVGELLGAGLYAGARGHWGALYACGERGRAAGRDAIPSSHLL